MISRWRRITKQRFEIDVGVLLTFVQEEIKLDNKVTFLSISSSLGWTAEYSKKVNEFAQKQKLLEKDEEGNFLLTTAGVEKVEHYNR